MWEWHMGSGTGWWILMPVMMIVFWGALFWLITSMTRGNRSQMQTARSGTSAMEIAAVRFASGEIDESEYSRIAVRLES